MSQGEQISLYDLGLWSGKMSPEPSQVMGGEDFRVVLEETARVIAPDTSIPRLPSGESWSDAGTVLGDGWSIAWRVHSAEFWGVPQRRRRISLVADFRGTSAPEILFEREGLSRDSDTSGAKAQGAADSTSRGIGKAISFQERGGRQGEPIVASKASFFLQSRSDGIADTLVATDYKDPQCVCYGLDRASFNQGKNAKFDFSVEEELAQTITSRGCGGGNDEIVGPLQARDFKGVGNQYVSEGKLIIQRIGDRKPSE